jgi:hypothetical protein
MSSHPFLIAFAVLLTVLPLDFSPQLPLLLSLEMNIWEVGAAMVLVLFYIFSFYRKVSLNLAVVFFSTVTTFIVLLVGFYGFQPIVISSLIRLFIIIWFLPFFDWLCTEYGGLLMAMLGFLILVLHAHWGIGHFIVQHDLGLAALGEVKVSPLTSGVAKFRMWQEENNISSSGKILRAYGPYTHANDYGGSLAVGLSLLSLFSVLYSWKFSTVHYLFSIIIFVFASAYILILGALFSFSRAVYLSLFITGLLSFFLLATYPSKLVPIFRWWRFLLIVFFTLIILFPFLEARFSDTEDVGISERISGYGWSLNLVGWRGAGPGNYPRALGHYLDTYDIPYASWQSTYVHSAPLLLVVEWGIFFLALWVGFIIWFFKLYWPVPWYLLSIVPLLLFDHYLVTQIAPMLWVMLLVTVGGWCSRQKLW